MRALDSRPITGSKTAGCFWCISEKIRAYQEKEIALDTSQSPLAELRTVKKGTGSVYACERHYREEMGL